jgi:hypothetical protein
MTRQEAIALRKRMLVRRMDPVLEKSRLFCFSHLAVERALDLLKTGNENVEEIR